MFFEKVKENGKNENFPILYCVWVRQTNANDICMQNSEFYILSVIPYFQHQHHLIPIEAIAMNSRTKSVHMHPAADS